MIRGGLLSLTLLAWLGSGLVTASAQVVVAPAPVVSYYVPPVAVAPAYYYAPAVSYYYAAPIPVVAPVPAVVPTVATAPAVSYYVPAYPARVSRGLFGRTIVRTPFSKTKF